MRVARKRLDYPLRLRALGAARRKGRVTVRPSIGNHDPRPDRRYDRYLKRGAPPRGLAAVYTGSR